MTQKPIKRILSQKSFKLILPLRRYPEEAITLSCYKFLDNFYFKFSGNGQKIAVAVFARQSDQPVNKKKFERDFYTELNHNLVRLAVAKENKKLREMIVFKTFFSALPEKEKEQAVSGSVQKDLKFEDPLGIAVPWEEKYGPKKSAKKSGQKAKK